MTIVDGGCNLSKDSSRIGFAKRLPVADVVVQLPAGGDLHHQHHLLLVLKHCEMREVDIILSLFKKNLTFVDVNDVWMLDGGHDLDLSPDSDEVGLCLDLALLDRLDRHLPEILSRSLFTEEEITSENVSADDCAV